MQKVIPYPPNESTDNTLEDKYSLVSAPQIAFSMTSKNTFIPFP
jgi:hypothetical protein